MKCFNYKEEPLSMRIPLLDQINEEGERGWRFHSMAQKIQPVKSLSLAGQPFGQPKVDIVLIYEREFETVIANVKDS
jgi:hypothetical protein